MALDSSGQYVLLAGYVVVFIKDWIFENKFLY